MVEIKPLVPLPTHLPRGYDANVRCDFHAGSPGHTTKKCLALKFKVQELLDSKIISFTPENTNVKDNPLLGHVGPTINTIEGLEDDILIKRVDQVKIPMTKVREIFIGYEFFKEMNDNCEVCLLNLEKCGKMKRCLQQMMDQGLVQTGYSRKVKGILAVETQRHIHLDIPYQRR